MESKEEIKKQLNGKSPDIADAMALTFSERVAILEEKTSNNGVRVVNRFK